MTEGASGAALIALLALAACGPAKTPAAPPPPQAVEAVAVSAPRASGGVTATGTLERRREMALSFRIAGVLTRVSVEAGDAVRAGQVLAAIDPAAVDARQQASSSDLDKARRDLERAKTLYAKGYVAKVRVDDAESAVRSAGAAYNSAAFDRRWAQLVSPASGVVLERKAQAGEVVQPGQAVVSIADLNSPLVLRVPLPDRDVAGIGVGAPVEVTVDALPGQILAGRVTRVGQSADARTGAVTVEIEVAARPELRSGQIATARLASRVAATTNAGFARIPAEAVLEASGGKAAVLRLDGAKGEMRARRTPVQFGGFDGDDALVAGLPDGARVITAGAGFVSDGDRVTVTDPRVLGKVAGQ
ncbi:transporter [Caulobacter sp. Root487D2Y]|uniref:efflux RND transporter periplasmic adaptor subunit n=1 Tax=Caulobacter sp. Root487D2Y TaxID=1736547 RepID=UPI000700E476|nr:efflux RND transporter periplasmic adaptor subunit [Caulobacter sp. Root487D2Y]KQY27654.1 transporter [Caulobacter sp. Root487D2Y]